MAITPQIGEEYYINECDLDTCGDGNQVHHDDNGMYIKITGLRGEDGLTYEIMRSDGSRASGCNCYRYRHLAKLKSNSKSNKTFMGTLIEKFKKVMMSEPDKSLLKAGVIDESLNLTQEGKELFIQYIFEQNKEEFKKSVVDVILAEEEKQNK